MERYFNTEGVCDPDIHYMVNLDVRLSRIKQRYVDKGKYFIINKGRQYGKTTTLRALAEYLKGEYLVCAMDFQETGTEEFRDEAAFSHAFAEILLAVLNSLDLEKTENLTGSLDEFSKRIQGGTLRELFARISRLCMEASQPVVLIIDEVDSASNNQVFLDFLAILRSYYLERKKAHVSFGDSCRGV